MKTKLFIALIFGLFVAACNKQEQRTIDITDITGESERYKEGHSSEVVPVIESDSTLEVTKWFVDNGVPVSSVEYRVDRMFPDRFGAISMEKYKLITPVDTILYSKWVYADSLKVMNAFTNWINCFGDNCKTIFFGEAKNFQRNPLQILINDSTLIFIESENSIDFKGWNGFHKVEEQDNPWNYVIEQPRWTKARWYTFPEGKRTKVEL